jgi:hypothetical protein
MIIILSQDIDMTGVDDNETQGPGLPNHHRYDFVWPLRNTHRIGDGRIEFAHAYFSQLRRLRQRDSGGGPPDS